MNNACNRNTNRCRVLLFLLCAILTACATTSLPPVTREGVVFEKDEKRLWLRSKELQGILDESGHIYQDEVLESYLNQVAARLQPPEVYQHIPFRVKVIQNPLLNAFALPHGTIYIHTGLLARMENEAQLATLLAHEMTHCTHRHTVRQFRHIKNTTAFLATVQVTVGGLGGGVGELTTLLGSIGALAAVTGYSREHETEADIEGLRRVIEAGYDPSETPKLFIHLKKELEEEKQKEPFFFGTHPRVQERIENYETFLAKQYRGQSGGIKNSDIFLEKIQELILFNASLDLDAGRFKTAKWGVEKYLERRPNDARAYHLLGEIFREEGDQEKAEAYYKKAISSDPDYPEPYKGMGLIYYKGGKKRMAKEYLEKYLSLLPQSPDRLYIEEYLRHCMEGEERK